jgi:hypothetical protein
VDPGDSTWTEGAALGVPGDVAGAVAIGDRNVSAAGREQATTSSAAKARLIRPNINGELPGMFVPLTCGCRRVWHLPQLGGRGLVACRKAFDDGARGLPCGLRILGEADAHLI